MPHKPAKPCAFPGCPNLTHSKYCETHRFMKQGEDKIYNDSRDKAIKNHYSAKWKKVRDAFLVEHPFCEICKKHGHLIKAEHVHHIVEVRDGGTDDEDNLVSLCKGCHTQIHGKAGTYKKKYKEYTYDSRTLHALHKTDGRG